MRVVCDNCGASYRIPDYKLVKEVNKATCRKCGEAIIIRKSAGMAVGDTRKEVDPEASTQVTELADIQGSKPESEVANIPSGPAMGHGFGQPAHLPEDAGPPTVAQHMDCKDETIPRQDLPEPTAVGAVPSTPPKAPPAPMAAPPTPMAAPPTPSLPQPKQSEPPPPPAPARPPRASGKNKSYDPSGDLTVVMMSNFVCAAGAMFIVVAQDTWHRPMGLFVCLAGAILSLSVVITSDRGRRPSAMAMSYFVSCLVAGAAAFGLHTYENSEPGLVVQDRVGPVEPVPVEDPPADLDALVDADAEENMEDLEADIENVVDLEEQDPAPSATATPRSGTGSFPEGNSGSSSQEAPARTVAPKDDWNDDWDDDWEEPARPEPTPEPRRRDPVPEPTPEPVRAEPVSEGVPLVVLDTMLRSNRKVKGCFVSYKRETGSMPSGRINVRFKVKSTGRPQEVRIADGPYAGTSLDDCLGGAVSSIQFPPFEGESKTYTYPFML